MSPLAQTGTAATLLVDPQNPNKGTDRGRAVLTDSLRRLGAGRSILVDKHGVAIAGNKTLEAARGLGVTKTILVPTTGQELVVVQRTDLDLASDAAARELAVADNRASELGLDWDVNVLATLLGERVDLSAFFTASEGHTDPDAVPEVRETTLVPGDVWALGAPRLVCGDCTDAEAVAAVMAGATAACSFTSPPYAQQRTYGATAPIDWDALMRGMTTCLPIASGGQVLVNLGLVHQDGAVVRYWDGWLTWLETEGWRLVDWYVWDQGFGFPGDHHGRFAPSHEFIFHLCRDDRRVVNKTKRTQSRKLSDQHKTAHRSSDGQPKPWTHKGRRIQAFKVPDSVVRVTRAPRENVGLGHPAIFPVALPMEVFGAFCVRGDVVYEPFAGAGTSIMAAERLGLSCRAVELVPAYCQMAIDRWEAFTGQTAECLTHGRKPTQRPTARADGVQAPARRSRARRSQA
jgi:DNA modification methylase